jgi:DNA primase
MPETPLNTFVEECHRNLVTNKPSHVVSYLKSRGLTDKTILDHKIGYCSDRSDIPDAVRHYGKDDPDFAEGQGYSYFIENKLILPVYSEFGETIGMATREAADKEGCHWWNLPRPFSKGNHMFLLNRGRGEVFKKNKIYIMEGYIDGLMAFQNGLFNVGVIMGTALTRRKIGLIARYCENICFCLDTDENNSGQNATKKSMVAVDNLNFCTNISTIELPLKEDPASFLIKNSMADLLNLEREVSEEEIEEIKEELWASSKNKKQRKSK